MGSGSLIPNRSTNRLMHEDFGINEIFFRCILQACGSALKDRWNKSCNDCAEKKRPEDYGFDNHGIELVSLTSSLRFFVFFFTTKRENSMIPSRPQAAVLYDSKQPILDREWSYIATYYRTKTMEQ